MNTNNAIRFEEWLELNEAEQMRLRGGPEPVSLVAIGALIVMTATLVYDVYNGQAMANAANLANQIEVAKFKYDHDPMSLTDHERDILGLNNGPVPVVKASSPGAGDDVLIVFKVPGVNIPPQHPGEIQFIIPNSTPQLEADWNNLVAIRNSFDDPFSGGGGGGYNPE